MYPKRPIALMPVGEQTFYRLATAAMTPCSLKQVTDFPNIRSIGKNAAEADAVLDYFLTTDAVRKIESNDAFLILGRKGSGKTALVRHFTKDENNPFAVALNLRGYPWGLHAALGNEQVSEIERYVASWRYLIAAQAASAVLSVRRDNEIDEEKKLRTFFRQNYGAPSVDVERVFALDRLKIDKAVLNPQIAGNSIGSIEFKSVKPDFGQQIEAVASEVSRLVAAVMKYRGNAWIELHFDELDFGIERFERQRELMIVGLVLAAQTFSGGADPRRQLIRPFVYLRHDLWDSFNFSDRNKISRGAALFLNWNSQSLQQMVDVRLTKLIGLPTHWSDLIDSDRMRGTQQKWDYIVARTLDRPRDVISFINMILESKSSDGLLSNDEVNAARAEYSTYFKEELDDEIKAHWPLWEDAIAALRDIGYVTFTKPQFIAAYDLSKTADNPIQDGEAALKKLFEYSVVTYRRPKGGGGSEWNWRYKNRTATFDSRAESFRVHPGLIEFANLREERRPSK
ncbi:P-loop ATPase, Sll1717 family [Sphingomonas sp. A2-49]|uniref:P-loop ATPase, Sll1717 family n=1 Tax=Sphingomonas sp. A2-49 TaxID=1391375 RepID=UPI003977D5DC